MLSLIESICFNLIFWTIFNDYSENVRPNGEKIGMPQCGLCTKSKVVPLTVFFCQFCLIFISFFLYFCLVMFFFLVGYDDVIIDTDSVK